MNIFDGINPYAHGLRIRNKEDFFPQGFGESELEGVYYRLIAGRLNGYAILESPAFEEVDDYYNPGEYEVEHKFIVEAVVIDRFAKTERKMQAFVRALQKYMAKEEAQILPLDPVVGKPKKAGSYAYVTVQIPFDDGQSIFIVFHSPEGDKKKIGPDDQLIAFRWLMNKRDITHVVAPEGGQEITLESVSKRISQLISKNHTHFVATQKAAVEEQQKLEALKEQASALEVENQSLADQSVANDTEAANTQVQIEGVQAKIEQQKAYNADLEAQISAWKAKKAAKSSGGTDPATTFPWAGASAEDENRWFGTVLNISAWNGTDRISQSRNTGNVLLHRVMNGGTLLEVNDGSEVSQDTYRVNVSDVQMSVVNLVDNKAGSGGTPKPGTEPQTSGDKPSAGYWTQPDKKFIASGEGQKYLSDRGARIATLNALNEQYAGKYGLKAYSDSELSTIADENIDAVRDWLIEQNRKEKEPAETLTLAPAAEQTGNPAKRVVKILFQHGLESRVMGAEDFKVHVEPKQGPTLYIEKASATIALKHLEKRNGKVVIDQAVAFALNGNKLELSRTTVMGSNGMITGTDSTMANVFTKSLIDQGLAKSGVLKEGFGMVGDETVEPESKSNQAWQNGIPVDIHPMKNNYDQYLNRHMVGYDGEEFSYSQNGSGGFDVRRWQPEAEHYFEQPLIESFDGIMALSAWLADHEARLHADSKVFGQDKQPSVSPNEAHALEVLDAIIAGEYGNDTAMIDQKLDEAAGLLEDLGLMEKYDAKLNEAADVLTVELSKKAKEVM